MRDSHWRLVFTRRDFHLKRWPCLLRHFQFRCAKTSQCTSFSFHFQDSRRGYIFGCQPGEDIRPYDVVELGRLQEQLGSSHLLPNAPSTTPLLSHLVIWLKWFHQCMSSWSLRRVKTQHRREKIEAQVARHDLLLIPPRIEQSLRSTRDH